ncbi:MAG: regulatory iron-sulfur-containing complex subunit RicT [Candidatus Heteroscillospira sp.]
MTEVVSVRFKNKGKLYFFAPNGLDIADGSAVVVETAKGLELGDCVYGNHWVTDERVVPPLRPVVREATEDDLRVQKLNKAREKEAFSICQKKIAAHGLDMKLVDVECSFEGNKIIFFFASEGRVDFRELVKDLAGVFRTRIELRQIGVRDEAKMLGGLGICGRPFCCSQFLDDFAPVSTKMAKTQSMSLNPSKISGSCGRLMCCLRYEQEAYEELVKNVPKNGAFVQTTQGYGNVAQINLLRQKIKVRLDGADQTIKVFDPWEVAAVPGGRPKPGDPLPVVLKPRESAPSEPEQQPESAAPPVSPERRRAAQPAPAPAPAPSADEKERAESKPQQRRRSRPRKSKPAAEQGDKPRQGAPQSKAAAGAQAPSSGKAPRPASPKKPPQERQPRQENAPAQDGAKKNEGRRRYYHRRPKAPGSGKSE